MATLSGHTSTDLIDRVYSAVAKDHEFLLERAKEDVGIFFASQAKGPVRQ